MASSYPTPKSPKNPWPPRIQDTDTITPEGNRKGSVESVISFNSWVSVGSVTFEEKANKERFATKKLETKKLNLAAKRKHMKMKVDVFSIEKCQSPSCSRTTFRIDSPTRRCDKRLERFHKFITRHVNYKSVNDDKRKNGPTFKIFSKVRKSLNSCMDQDIARNIIFEVRIAHAGYTGAEPKWTTNFFEPRWWDPSKRGPDSEHFYKEIGWRVCQPFQVSTGHWRCPLERGERYCSAECTKKDFFNKEKFKDFRLVRNVENLVLVMQCNCGRGKNMSEKLEVYMYERRRETSPDRSENNFLDEMDNTFRNMERTTSHQGENILATIEEEAGTVIPRDEVGLEHSTPQSFKDESIPATNVDETEAMMQNLELNSDDSKPQSLKDEQLSSIDPEIRRDSAYTTLDGNCD